MKRIFILSIFLMFLIPMELRSQTSMTDSQVMNYVMKEKKNGTSNAQIVTKLMQQGVDISQIRRVRKQYERTIKDKGLGVVADETQAKAENRMRKNNEQKKKSDTKHTDQKLTDIESNYTHTYDKDDPDFVAMSKELGALYSDTLKVDDKEKKPKVFGRDIFNNKLLTFEPNMNIATPQNYRLGPGDAVFIDVYGASQRTIQDTVSPDGTVTIEGYGPVSVAGLTVEQANARLRSTLGSRYSSSKIRLTVGQTKTIIEGSRNLYPFRICHRLPCPLHGRWDQRFRYLAQYQGLSEQPPRHRSRHLRLYPERSADRQRAFSRQ